jgi:hypothetical protein
MPYPLLDIYAFGEQLLRSKDIDPVYVVLENSGWSNDLKARWCLAYWCTYHVGVASYIAGMSYGGDPAWFWQFLGEAARNTAPAPTGERWPRGKERRHWRGQQAIDSLNDLQRRYSDSPENFVATVGSNPNTLISMDTLSKINSDPIPYSLIAQRVRQHVGFGPWMAFKIADMLEQVFRVRIDFDNAAVFMFKDPKEAALRFWRLKYKLPDNAKPRDEDEVINGVVDHLQKHFSNFLAPTERRFVNLQEVETILCKWKSHLNGHYPLLNDVHELRAGATPWTRHSKLAQLFVDMPGVPK